MAKTHEQQSDFVLLDKGAQFMRRTEIEQVLRIGRSTIYGLMSQGKFPKPVRISPRSVAWRVSDIEEYLEKLQGDF